MVTDSSDKIGSDKGMQCQQAVDSNKTGNKRNQSIIDMMLKTACIW